MNFRLFFSLIVALIATANLMVAQTESRVDVIADAGLCMQFAKVVNEGWDAGGAVNVQAAWKVREGGGLRLWLGYDRFRSTMRDSLGKEDVSAEFISIGLRTDLYNPLSAVRSFFLIGFGGGSSRPDGVVANSDSSLGKTAVQFGAGVCWQIREDLDFVSMARCVVGARSGFSIPVTLGMRWRL